MQEQAIKLYNYNIWANNRIFDHLKQLPGEVYKQEVESVFSSISEVVTHIYRVDGMWLSVMSGDSFDETMQIIQQYDKKAENKNLGQMQELYVEMSHDFQTLFDSTDDLEAPMAVTHPKYGSLDTSTAELIQHVVNHGTYHRGNITAMLRQQDHAGVPTDYVFYLYEIA